MKRKRDPPDDPREWLSRAKSNLALARNVIPEVDLADLCFDAQQAAEKAIKAIFIKRGETFPYSHDVDKLLRLLETNGLKIPKYVNEAKELTQYAHETRYPGLAAPVTRRAYRRAIRTALLSRFSALEGTSVRDTFFGLTRVSRDAEYSERSDPCRGPNTFRSEDSASRLTFQRYS